MSGDGVDIFKNWVGSGLWEITLVVCVWILARVGINWPSARKPPTEMGKFAVAECLRMIRQICGFIAVIYIGYLIVNKFFSDFQVWRHIAGWLLIAVMVAIAIIAYTADPPLPHPKRQAVEERKLRIWHRITNIVLGLVLLCAVIYAIYFDPETVQNRRNIQSLENQMAETKIKMAAAEQRVAETQAAYHLAEDRYQHWKAATRATTASQ